MKKLIGISVFLGALTLVSTDVFALYWNAKRGPEWVKNPSRSATVDSVDAAQYNPAGLTQLQPGIYIYIGNQFAIKNWSITSRDTDRRTSDTTPVWFCPNISVAWVFDKAAAFITYDVVNGSANGDYKCDTENTLSFAETIVPLRRAKGGYSTTATTLGVSYALNDMIAVSAGMRYLYYNSAISLYSSGTGGRLKAVIANTAGFTGFVGVDITPIEKLNITMLYQPTVRMKGEKRTVNDVDNSKTDALDKYVNGFLSFGIGYVPIENLTVSFSFFWNFEASRRYGNSSGAAVKENENMRADLEFALGAEYSLGLIRPSIGINYQRVSNTSDSRNAAYLSSYNSDDGLAQVTEPILTNVAIGAGVAIVPNEMLRIDVGLMRIFSADGSGTGLGGNRVKIERDAWIIALGVGAKF